MSRRFDQVRWINENGAGESISEAWATLRSYLECRSRELNEEVRSYPTPIARCDEQLTTLIDQRAQAIRQLQLVTELDPRQLGNDDRQWLARIDEFLTSPQLSTDDAVETAARSCLREAVRAGAAKAG